MFSKLALKNVTRSMRDFSVYFLTLMFGVCIFYVFNSMESQTVMSYLSGESRNYIREMIVRLIDVLSVFVSVVLAFLILYANTFLIRRRKRELGTYMLLGMGQGRISMILFLETLCIGVIALGVGLLLGIFLSQFLSVFTAGIFSIHMTEFHFVFSLSALLKTCFYFGIIFLLVMIFNALSVSRCKLIDLMEADRQNQSLKLRSLKASVVMFLLGVVLLIVAYRLLLERGIFRVDNIFFLMLGLGTLGTLLFFRSLSGFLLEICQKSKGLYFRNLNMFVLRQFNSKINTTYVSMTVICLMLLLAIGITACAVGLNNTIEQLTSGAAPYDMTVRFFPEEGEAPPLAQWLTDAGFDPEEALAPPLAFDTVYVELPPRDYQVGGRTYTEGGLSALSISDCNALLKLQGRPPLELGEDAYGILWGTYEADESVMKSFWAEKPVITAGGETLYAEPAAESDAVIFTYAGNYESFLILPDRLMSAGKIESRNVVGNYAVGVDAEEADARLVDAVHNMVPSAYINDGHGYGYYSETRLNVYMETMGSKILVLFLGIYLGIVFLLTSAAVLALQQLSQAADNVGRYQILSRLGVPEKMRDRSLYIQVFLYFFLPLALAVVHAVVGMTAANAAIAEIGHVDAAASSLVTAAFLLVIYGAYFLATCWGSRRMIRGK